MAETQRGSNFLINLLLKLPITSVSMEEMLHGPQPVEETKKEVHAASDDPRFLRLQQQVFKCGLVVSI